MTQKGKTCKFRWNTVIHNSNEKPNFMLFVTLNNSFYPKCSVAITQITVTNFAKIWL